MRLKLTLLLLASHASVLALVWLVVGDGATVAPTVGPAGEPGLRLDPPVLVGATAAVALTAVAAVLALLTRPISKLGFWVDGLRREREYDVEVPASLRRSFGAPLAEALSRLGKQVAREVRASTKMREHLEQELRARDEELAERTSSERRMRHLAYYDALTDLPNRQLLCERLEAAIAEPRDDGELLAILYLDLDRFKEVNDTHGHGEGDRLLRIVGERLVRCVRDEDLVSVTDQGAGHESTVSRHGGDEFTILLRRMRSLEDVSRVARRVAGVLAEPVELGDKTVSVGASIGIAAHPDHGRSASELLKHADMAMYAAKSTGRNQHEFFSHAMRNAAIRRRALEEDLRRALDYGHLRLHYQPKVSLKSGELSGFEALVRWIEPSGSEVPPSEFVPIAEEIGLVHELGEWVLRRACEQARTWRKAGRPVVPIAVNVSSLELRDERFLERVRRVLAETALRPDMLELEITESAMIENPHAVVRALEELRAVGVRVALDDFGTGYSSLVHVRQLPLDVVKLDASFVRGLPFSQECTSIVSAVVGMAHSLELSVVAEGVERVPQAACLHELGCDQIQGYLISAAQPPAEAEPMLGAIFDVNALIGRGAEGVERPSEDDPRAPAFPEEAWTH